MNYIIFDMEWNQPSTPQDKKAALRQGEIVQLGFFVLDERLEILHKENITVRPVVYPTMNEFVSALTGITQDRAEHGVPFHAAISEMAKYFETETVLFTWGDDDLPILKNNMAFHGIEIGLPPHYNLQRIFCTQTQTPAVQIGLKTAADQFLIDTNLQTHDALNDAYITLLIARQLDLIKGIRQYHRKSVSSPPNDPQQPWLFEKPLLTDETDYFGSIDGMAAFCGTLFTDCPICGKGLGSERFCRFRDNAFVTKMRCPDDGDFFAYFEKNNSHLRGNLYTMTPSLERIYSARVRRREKSDRYRRLRRQAARLSGK